MPFLLLLTLFNLGSLPTNTAPQLATALTPTSDFYIGSQPSQFVAFGDLLYFLAATDSTDVSYLHTTDGSAEGMAPVLLDGQPLDPRQFLLNQGVLYLVTDDYRLATIDAPGSAPRLTEISCGTIRRGERGVLYIRDGNLYGFALGEGERFIADLPVNTIPPAVETALVELDHVVYVAKGGYEDKLALYRMDGSGEPSLVVDLYTDHPLDRYDVPSLELERNGDRLIITANFQPQADGPWLGRVWSSDGSAEGTELVAAISVDSPDHYPLQYVGAWQDSLLILESSASRHVLLALDGAGERVLSEFQGFDLHGRTERGDQLFFRDGFNIYRLAADGDFDTVFTTDDLIFEYNAIKPIHLDAAGNLRFFTGDELEELQAWISDGNEGGTQALNLPEQFTLRRGEFADFGHIQWYVGSRDQRHEVEAIQISATNGAQFLDLNPNLRVNHLNAVAFGNRLLFQDPADGYPLRITDGTPAGTLTLTHLNQSRFDLAVGDHVAYFWKTGNGPELWKTDGTPAGTVLVAQFPEAKAFQKPGKLVASGDELFLTTFREPYEVLYHSDGTEAGTRPIDLMEHRAGAPNYLFPEPNGGIFVVTADERGTYLLYVGPHDDHFTHLTLLPTQDTFNSITAYPIAGRNWFVFRGRQNAIWVTDRTAAGTLLFADDLDEVSNIVAWNGQATLFLRKQASQGLVRSDGTVPYEPETLAFSPSARQLFQPTGQMLYGVDDRIWVHDGTNPARTLVDLPVDGQARDIIETAAGTLLITDDSLGLTGTLTDGTLAGTRQLFTSAFDGIIYKDVQPLGDRVHLIGQYQGNRLLYRWEPGLEAPVVDEEGAGLEQVPAFFPAGDRLYFPASQDGLQVGLFSLGADTAAELAFRVTPWFFLPSVFRVEITPIPGAVYHWTVDGGTLLSNGQNAFVYVNLNGSGMATVHLTVDLPDGSHRQGQVPIVSGIRKATH